LYAVVCIGIAYQHDVCHGFDSHTRLKIELAQMDRVTSLEVAGSIPALVRRDSSDGRTLHC